MPGRAPSSPARLRERRIETRFANRLDADRRSRRAFHFHNSEILEGLVRGLAPAPNAFASTQRTRVPTMPQPRDRFAVKMRTYVILEDA